MNTAKTVKALFQLFWPLRYVVSVLPGGVALHGCAGLQVLH